MIGLKQRIFVEHLERTSPRDKHALNKFPQSQAYCCIVPLLYEPPLKTLEDVAFCGEPGNLCKQDILAAMS
jgi:hypothetical protein